ncbi:MAG TPA: RHS repeat-associated core domain-containing protein [Terriglobales bacterium]|nr:RHS repeat-associated core domain-containing protein [Terriglobales bacterium]
MSYNFSLGAGDNGNVTSITNNRDNTRSQSFTYDALNRIASAQTAGSTNFPAWGLSWTYDRYGNRLAQNVTAGSGVPSNSVSVDPTTNRINSAGYGYDAGGNMTNDGLNTMVYDGENHVASSAEAGVTTNYTYDGNGLRLEKATGSNSTVYLFSGSKVVAEYDNGAAVASPSREYIYSGGRLLATIDSAGTKYHLSGHLSPHITTDASGNVIGTQAHYPFGEKWYETGTTTKYKFTSYERDPETGNDFAIARYDVNRLGRFSSADPLAGSASDPQSLNRYTYVANNPTNFVDPSGLLLKNTFVAEKGDDTMNCVVDGIETSCNDVSSSATAALPAGFTSTVGFVDGQLVTLSLDSDPDVNAWEASYAGLTDAQVEELGLPTEFDPASGNSGSNSGGNTSDTAKPWELRSNVVALLRAKNDCSAWFNKGTGSAADIMSHVPILLYNPKEVSYDMPDANTGDNPQTPIYVNNLGRFYTDRYNWSLVGDVYSAGSFGARSVILLHELAHKVMPPGFIANDADTPGASEKNTQMVINHCAKAIGAQKP